MRPALLPLALSLAGLLPLACDAVKKATSNEVMVATLLSSPPRAITPAAFVGSDGGAPPDAGTVNVPGSTAAFVFFGQFQGFDDAPEPITGAAVELRPSEGEPVSLDEVGQGTYTQGGTGEGALTYVSGATYEFVASADGEEYVGEVANAPALERILKLDPPTGYLEHDANTTLTLVRPSPSPGQERNVGFVTVVPISATGERGEPTYSNVPTTPLEFLALFAKPSDYKQDSVGVPPEAFPQAQSTYLVIFQAAKLGKAKSNNLQLASALMAGTAQVGVVRTR